MKITLRAVSVLLVVVFAFCGIFIATDVVATSGTQITYNFKNDLAGYAEGKLTLLSDTAGTYKLYWADDTAEISGYYPIADEMKLTANSSQSFSFGYHTAIPYGATRVIAKDSGGSIVASYNLPANKLLSAGSGNLLYKFNSYSDVHIDNAAKIYYTNARTHWAEALKFGVDTGTDFIISSGDMVTNAEGPYGEWDIYEKILSQSDYVNPVWESNGNHDLRTGVATGITAFVRASGTDNTIENYDENKPYYCIKENSTGDIFIFMALEKSSSPHSCDEFSPEQMEWVTNLIETYYGSGVNIYIVEHSPIERFGAGDRMSRQYYKALLSEKYISTVQFKSLLQKYPKLIFMSGHTHEDFSMGYNYSDEQGTACSMIHNPAVAGSTWAGPEDTSLDYNNGIGYNSQGYLVEVYQNEVVYCGANLTDELIYPAYCYIMEGSRGASPQATNATAEITTADPTSTTGVTGCTLPEETATKRVYFSNTVKWETIACHSWGTNSSVKSIWPGYGAVFYGTTEQGVDLYYCDIPEDHSQIVWNNGDNGIKTADIALDGVNDFFTPTTLDTDGNYKVSSAVWTYDPVTEPSSSTEESSSSEDNSSSSEDNSESSDSSSSSSQPITDPSSQDNSSSSEEQNSSSSEDNSSSSEETSSSSEETPAEPEFPLGDVSKDKTVNTSDATMIQQYLAGLIHFSEEQIALADTSGDFVVNINDATLIQYYRAGYLDKLPGEKAKTIKASTSASSTEAKSILEQYYSFASYDQYQNLKKLYKNGASSAQLDTAITSLKEIADYINGASVVYFFENTYNWTNVYAYAWKGSNLISAWPGVKLQKVGDNYGHGVYGVRFDYADQYDYIIFNEGSSGEKTQDIKLSDYSDNTFYISGSGNNGLTVGSFNGTFNEPMEHYALLYYYNDGAHNWSNYDTFLKRSADGSFSTTFTTSNSSNFSFAIYDSVKSKFNSMAASGGFVYSQGAENTYTLSASDSRQKSITISGLTAGKRIKITYYPASNSVKVTCLN